MPQISLRLSVLFLWTLVLAGAPAVSGQEPLDGVVWVRSTGSDSYSGQGDRGIGIAYCSGGAGYGRVKADTLLIRAQPDPGSAVVGAFLYTELKPGISWSYSVGAPVRLRPNVLEFGYEESGIPLDSLAVAGSWGRVILGFHKDGAPYHGWMSLDSTRVKYLLWRKVLAHNRVFFLPGQPPRFYANPAGRKLPLSVETGSNADYILHPLEVRGPWMRVRVAEPADICGSDAAKSRTAEAWIRYLRADGRPLVWYYTRGC
ncbi:MAG: hypothetical protein M3Q37_01905 [Gemmatimonadota bacterium]|nr:hypothetical protein [Gemmatimonadota bacterium]